jgi:hypothetical protein
MADLINVSPLDVTSKSQVYIGKRWSCPVLSKAPHSEDVLRVRTYSSMPPFPQYAFMAWCLVKAQGQLYLYLLLDGGEWLASRPGRSTPQVKSRRYPLDRRLGGPHSRSWRDGVKKKSYTAPCRELNRCHSARCLVSILTELRRLWNTSMLDPLIEEMTYNWDKRIWSKYDVIAISKDRKFCTKFALLCDMMTGDLRAHLEAEMCWNVCEVWLQVGNFSIILRLQLREHDIYFL